MMRPHLIIDIRERSMFGLLVDVSGKCQPCTHNVMGNFFRYFFGEIFMEEKSVDLNGDGSLDLLNNLTVSSDEYDISYLGEKLGWRWPYQSGIDETAIPVKHPLQVLSAPLLSENNEIMTRILITCYAMLEFMLEPLFRYVRSQGFEINEVNAIVIIPNYFNRRAKLLLYKIFRKRKFYRTILISREIAAMMYSLELSFVDDVTVFDMENEDAHFYRGAIEKSSGEVRLQCSDHFTIKGFGWQSMLKEFGEELYKQKLIDKNDAGHILYIDRALMGLIYGVFPMQDNGFSSLKISHSLFDKIFIKSGKKNLGDGYFARLKDSNLEERNRSDTFIPLGLPPMIGSFEKELLSTLKRSQVSQVLSQRSLERSAYGMAAGLNWLYQGKGRKIKIANQSGLRIAVQTGESIELVPFASLPVKPGEKRTIRQVLDFHLGENLPEDIVNFQLLWGMNSNPGYNINVCLLSLNVTRADHEKKNRIEAIFNLMKAKAGNSIIGNVTICLGDQSETAGFTLENVILEIGPKDIM